MTALALAAAVWYDEHVVEMITTASVPQGTDRASSQRSCGRALITPERVPDLFGGQVARYSELLKDPRWQRLRLQVFERDGWACRSCHAKDRQLQVHHTRYLAYFPWDTPIEHLVTLCDACHARTATRSLCGDSDFWPVIKMADGTYLKGPRAELVGRWQ